MMAGTAAVSIVFNRFPEIIAKAPGVARAAVSKAAFDIEGRAKATVPVDTGNLKNSIRTEMAELSAVVGTHVEYAPYVEFGTVRMGARPYLVPAAEAVRPSFLQAMEEIAKV